MRQAVAIVVALDGRSIRGAVAREPVEALGGRPRPRTAQSSSDRCCLTSGISVCTASSMSASVLGPGPRATPVRIQAGRFWYIRPRVPSIGSTMMTHRARLSVGACRHDDLAAGQPLGHQQHRPLRASRSSADLCDEHLLGHAVDRVDRVALCFGRDADSSATAAASHAPTTSSRMRRCRAWIGASSGWTGARRHASTHAGAEVVRTAGSGQLGGLLFRRRVAQEVAAADLGPGQVLEQVRPAQRRMELDVEVESSDVLLQRRLVKRHHVGERHPPQVVEPDDHVAEHRREIPSLLVVQCRNGRHAPQRRDVRLIGIAGEVRHERDGASM